jgi:hypothetical protein
MINGFYLFKGLMKSNLRKLIVTEKNTEPVENPKKFQNEFEAFSKRMGKHSAWFSALDSKKQWNLLFLWKKHKWMKNKGGQSISLKKFLQDVKKTRKFYVPIQRLRESTLNKLLN